MPSTSLVFMSWTPAHGRSTGLARALGARDVFVGGANYQPRSALKRYAANTVTTWRSLEQHKPAGVIVMLPPLPALLVVHIWARKRRAFVALDAHTGVFNDPKWRWALRPTLRLARKAKLTLVTNEPLADMIRRAGGEAAVVHNVPETGLAESTGGGGIVVPCSWAADEPIEAILEALQGLTIEVHVTGKPRADVAKRFPGVNFTGFLPDLEYEQLLHQADLVLAMTTRPFTMQQAGYEALARHVPLVTSDTDALRDYFVEGAVFSAPQAPAIAAAVRSALENAADLKEGMRRTHELRLQEWNVAVSSLRARLGV